MEGESDKEVVEPVGERTFVTFLDLLSDVRDRGYVELPWK